jgi:hypothetical protein
MLTIGCTFDEELGPGGVDPLGDVTISDGHSQIRIENTYLDSWLAALIDALQRLPSTPHVSVETEEPKPMQIDVAPDGSVPLTYNGQKVVARDRKELEFAVRSAANAFLEGLKNCSDASQNRILDPIRRFSVTTEN